MSNMSYCRFRNTLPDLWDCYEHWDEVPEDENEAKARERLIKLCTEIANNYGNECK